MPAATEDRLLVVSPHLDDAVLSCGCWLASRPGAAVVTVFAGRPRPAGVLTPWDAACGFTAGDDVVGRRREEDRAALALLHARPVWLDFLDAQYARLPDRNDLRAGLAATIAHDAPTTVAFPLGLFHSDHVRVSDAVLELAESMQGVRWVVYEEGLYRELDDAAAARRAVLEANGWRFERHVPSVIGDAAAAKRAALDCYPSQLRGLATPDRPDVREALAPERYLRVAGHTRASGQDVPGDVIDARQAAAT